jgi:hypothetical protein
MPGFLRFRNPADEAWRGYVSNADYVRAYVDKMPDIVARALDAGARPPLTYVGAGMTAAVFCDDRGRAFKVGRELAPILFHLLSNEAEWLEAAGKTPWVRDRVAHIYRFHAEELVIERECPMPSEAAWYRYRGTTWDLHREIEARMIPRGWTAPEYKEDSYVVTDDGPILVDASMAHRVGKNLLRYTLEVLRGRRPVYTQDRPSDFAFHLRMEVGKTLTETQVRPVLAALGELEAHGNRWAG